MMTFSVWMSTAITLAAGPPGDEAAWEEIRNDEVRVECVEVAEQPWCRAHGVVRAPIAKVSDTLEHMPAHQDKFDMVLSIREIEAGLLHITLDYPRPFSDRDYVARYTPATEGSVRWYRWAPAADTRAPEVDGVVRLPRFAGSWRLQPAGGNTHVTYTWHADVGGSFPRWAATTARKRAGHHALTDLAVAVGTTLVSE